MADSDKEDKSGLYLGVDVGGTKIQASLVEESGSILARRRQATPRDCPSDEVLAAIEAAIAGLLADEKVPPESLKAIGLVVPGVVDPDKGRVVVTPNMGLTGVKITPRLEKRFNVPVALGNDCNLCAAGEKWLGSAREADSMIGIFVGTGIGSGVMQGGQVWRGARECAGEIGHIVMEIGGPECGCGNRGCLEALAGRAAIERDIRRAVADGRETVLTEMADDLSVIRSGMLRRGLIAKDDLVTEVMTRASEVLGWACLTVRHLLDPDAIVLGGGVMEACGDFMLPIVEGIVATDKLTGAREGGRILLSALGDDAGVLGAVALARQLAGRDPFAKGARVLPKYPRVAFSKSGEVTVGKNTYDRDICIRVNGKVRRRKKTVPPARDKADLAVTADDVQKACKGGPEVLFIGTGQSGKTKIGKDAKEYLRRRAIECRALSTPDAIEAYNKTDQRKAALLRMET